METTLPHHLQARAAPSSSQLFDATRVRQVAKFEAAALADELRAGQPENRKVVCPNCGSPHVEALTKGGIYGITICHSCRTWWYG